jgi:surfactin synthase thioesterase subunit
MAAISKSGSSRSKSARPKSSRVKVSEHRARLRAQGLRPIQIWVPDVRAPSFRSEARRQSQAVAASVHARDDQAFIDSVSELADE